VQATCALGGSPAAPARLAAHGAPVNPAGLLARM
jgi:hypothetical protein